MKRTVKVLPNVQRFLNEVSPNARGSFQRMVERLADDAESVLQEWRPASVFLGHDDQLGYVVELRPVTATIIDVALFRRTPHWSDEAIADLSKILQNASDFERDTIAAALDELRASFRERVPFAVGEGREKPSIRMTLPGCLIVRFLVYPDGVHVEKVRYNPPLADEAGFE